MKKTYGNAACSTQYQRVSSVPTCRTRPELARVKVPAGATCMGTVISSSFLSPPTASADDGLAFSAALAGVAVDTTGTQSPALTMSAGAPAPDNTRVYSDQPVHCDPLPVPHPPDALAP